jgi:hypothetical protein
MRQPLERQVGNVKAAARDEAVILDASLKFAPLGQCLLFLGCCAPCSSPKARRGRHFCRLLVDEGPVTQVDGGKLILLAPVILVVLPLWLVAALGQEMHGAHDVTRIEVVRIDPG